MANQPRGRDSLLRSSPDHAAIRDREPGQRGGSVATEEVGASPAALRRPLVAAAIELTDPSAHADELAELWRNGAEAVASCCAATHVEEVGVRELERLVEGAPAITQLRLTGPDPRLATEIALAAGVRSIHGAGVAGAAAAERSGSGSTPQHWQYVDQLVGWYDACGRPVSRSYATPRQETSCPPAVACATLVLDALVGADAGVRHIVLERHENLHLQEDVAALRVLPRLARAYLRRIGHEDVSVSTALKIWDGEWPEVEADRFGLLGFTVLTASLGGARAVVIHPGIRADVRDTAKHVRFARSALVVTGTQRYPDSDSLSALEESIAHDAEAMIDATLALETGELRSAVALAFEREIVDTHR